MFVHMGCFLKQESGSFPFPESIIQENLLFFETSGDFPFDIFAAAFYLLSRYEEYLPFQPDKHGRFPHEASLAYKENFLHLPLVNYWLEDLKKALRVKFPEFEFSDERFQIHSEL